MKRWCQIINFTPSAKLNVSTYQITCKSAQNTNFTLMPLTEEHTIEHASNQLSISTIIGSSVPLGCKGKYMHIAGLQEDHFS
jgi:hypothetical protein